MINTIIFTAIIVAVVIGVFFYFKPPNKEQAKALYNKYEKWKAYCATNRCDIAKVYRIKQHASTGTKAYVEWLTRHGTDAIWVNKAKLSYGQLLVLHGNYGHGSHHNEEVFYVNSFEILPRKIIQGWQLHKATLEADSTST